MCVYFSHEMSFFLKYFVTINDIYNDALYNSNNIIQVAHNQ